MWHLLEKVTSSTCLAWPAAAEAGVSKLKLSPLIAGVLDKLWDCRLQLSPPRCSTQRKPETQEDGLVGKGGGAFGLIV